MDFYIHALHFWKKEGHYGGEDTFGTFKAPNLTFFTVFWWMMTTLILFSLEKLKFLNVWRLKEVESAFQPQLTPRPSPSTSQLLSLVSISWVMKADLFHLESISQPLTTSWNTSLHFLFSPPSLFSLVCLTLENCRPQQLNVRGSDTVRLQNTTQGHLWPSKIFTS